MATTEKIEMKPEPGEMTPEGIRELLYKLWTTVSDPRHHSTVKWIKGGSGFRIINAKVFYEELCPIIYPGCDEKYFNYFVEKCGFERIPPGGNDFFHEDFVAHQHGRVRRIHPKTTLYEPAAFYSYVLQTPNYEIPLIFEEYTKIEEIVVARDGTLKFNTSRNIKIISAPNISEDEKTEIKTFDDFKQYLKKLYTNKEIDSSNTMSLSEYLEEITKEDTSRTNTNEEEPESTVDLDGYLNQIRDKKIDSVATSALNKNVKETLALDLKAHSLSEEGQDRSPESTCSSSSTLVPDSFQATDPDTTPETLLPVGPSEGISTKDYEKNLALNLDECKLEEQASDSSSSTLTSGSNSPRTDLKASGSPNAQLSKDNMKSLISTLELDVVPKAESEESDSV